MISDDVTATATVTKHRSLWQVLAGYAVGSWVAYQVVLALRDGLGLPDKLGVYALLLLLLGLPVVIVTWYVQHRAQFRAESRSLRNLFTWKKVAAGGVIAFALLSFTTFVGFVIRERSTLVARGVITDDSPVLLADFSSVSGDSTLGTVVTDAIRVDMMQSNVIRLVQPSQIRLAFERMKRAAGSRMTGDVAREMAEREGYRAIIDGDVKKVGGGYVITMQVVAKDSIVLALNEVAKNADEFIPAVNRLSRALREAAGESLKSIRAGRGLTLATTASLPALRKYSEGIRLSMDKGDALGAVKLFEEAIALDSTFASAWLGKGVHLQNALVRPVDAAEAFKRAYALRDRLTERERYRAISFYEGFVNGDAAASTDALLHMVAADSMDASANNSLGLAYIGMEMPEKALPCFERAMRADMALASSNMAAALLALGRTDEALDVYRAAMAKYKDNVFVRLRAVDGFAGAGYTDAADSMAQAFSTQFAQNKTTLLTLLRDRVVIAYMSGRLRDGAALAERYREAASKAGLKSQALASLLGDAEVSLRVRRDPARARRELAAALKVIPLESLPPGSAPYLEVGMLYYELGDYDRANAMVSVVERPGSGFASAATRDAAMDRTILSSASAPAAALPAMLRASADVSCFNCRHDYLARTYEAAGMPDSARAVYERFLTRGDPRLFYHDGIRLIPAMQQVAELHARAGDTAGAVRRYTQLLRIWAKADLELQPQVAVVEKRLAVLRSATPR